MRGLDLFASWVLGGASDTIKFRFHAFFMLCLEEILINKKVLTKKILDKKNVKYKKTPGRSNFPASGLQYSSAWVMHCRCPTANYNPPGVFAF